ncbi:hypothetical protein F5148DRAFT_986616 [Russula earlei]|uniref:Uncharacterized protein n=1 Tax=Russula earlei TaxID=71964 RepID=A0ACC0TXL6_9AGAM|nr:hypothetical protein F5148DRAFT_986616 [Russula earlei]
MGQHDNFSRQIMATFYRLITGHTFIGEYTRRFYPKHTPAQITCQCGKPIQTVKHVLLSCPLFDDVRRRHLSAGSRPRNLAQLFNHPERAKGMLHFLKETKACLKLRETWDPGGMRENWEA